MTYPLPNPKDNITYDRPANLSTRKPAPLLYKSRIIPTGYGSSND
jgi:hypothetical protein